MANATALVVPCTKTKSVPPCDCLRFGALVPGSVEDIVEDWMGRALCINTREIVHQLYSGMGWKHALCAEQLLGNACQLWAVSAGFGLVRGDEPIPSYAATFAAENNRIADQVVGMRFIRSAHASWWKAINEKRGRSQTPLRSTFRDYDRVIIALSAPYLAAVCSDLELLAGALGPERLWLVAVGVDARTLSPELRQCAVPLTSQVEQLVSSPRATLNLRTLVWWLEEIVPIAGWDREAQQREIHRRLCDVAPKAVRVARTLSDKEVARWIEGQRAEVGGQWPHGGKTQLLKALRESGLACEQKRFSRICEEVR